MNILIKKTGGDSQIQQNDYLDLNTWRYDCMFHELFGALLL